MNIERDDNMFLFILKILKEYEGYFFEIYEGTFSSGQELNIRSLYGSELISQIMHFLINNCSDMNLIDYTIKRRQHVISFVFERK